MFLEFDQYDFVIMSEFGLLNFNFQGCSTQFDRKSL